MAHFKQSTVSKNFTKTKQTPGLTSELNTRQKSPPLIIILAEWLMLSKSTIIGKTPFWFSHLIMAVSLAKALLTGPWEERKGLFLMEGWNRERLLHHLFCKIESRYKQKEKLRFVQFLQGEEYKPLFHVSDWFPTLLKLSGCETPESADRPLDGKAQEILVYEPKATRNNILHFLDPLIQHDFNDDRDFSFLNKRAFNVTIKVKRQRKKFYTFKASYRSGRWKIITGKPCGNGCGYIKDSRNPSYEKDNTKLADMEKEQNKNVRLYDMWADKGEKFDKSGRFKSSYFFK